MKSLYLYSFAMLEIAHIYCAVIPSMGLSSLGSRVGITSSIGLSSSARTSTSMLSAIKPRPLTNPLNYNPARGSSANMIMSNRIASSNKLPVKQSGVLNGGTRIFAPSTASRPSSNTAALSAQVSSSLRLSAPSAIVSSSRGVNPLLTAQQAAVKQIPVVPVAKHQIVSNNFIKINTFGSGVKPQEIFGSRVVSYP